MVLRYFLLYISLLTSFITGVLFAGERPESECLLKVDQTLSQEIRHQLHASVIKFCDKSRSKIPSLTFIISPSGELFDFSIKQLKPINNLSAVKGKQINDFSKFVNRFFMNRTFLGYVERKVGKRYLIKKEGKFLNNLKMIKGVKVYPNITKLNYTIEYKNLDSLKPIEDIHFIDNEDDIFYLETTELKDGIVEGSMIFHSNLYKEGIDEGGLLSLGEFNFSIPFHSLVIKSTYNSKEYLVEGFGFGVGLQWRRALGRAFFLKAAILRTIGTLDNKEISNSFSGVSFKRTFRDFGIGVIIKQKDKKKTAFVEFLISYVTSITKFEGGLKQGYFSYNSKGVSPSLSIIKPIAKRVLVDFTFKTSIGYRIEEFVATREDVELSYTSFKLGLHLKKTINSFAKLFIEQYREANESETFKVKQTLFTMMIGYKF